ncbi:ATP-binding protein [Ohtaekwangia koreensis]|uniref:histidine kinase n=1 Tax=Ohtaekwangia koreensis TaxID=688867 RepID=A0A1T5MCH8_9BACT|nr:ATP-binding protein [Ohtaekwangia koreensis]SKC85947.1 His Kinase A (phospho-acceptor) domain-containing protein [Ohtaekwangia koreensis]
MQEQVTILMVDDKPSNLYALETLLDKPGRTFLSATNGNDALKFALNNDIDLIILDVQMPEMDGFEVAQILKLNKKTKDIPIIFASAEKKERQSIMKGFEEGGVDYLSKPLDPELTTAKVSVLLKIQLQKKELLEKNQSLEKADAQIKKLNADLNKNLLQLEEVNKELESFSYSVSHDLRAPVRALAGFSKMLEEDYQDSLDDEGKRLLGIIRKNALKMGTLIDDLLEFSKMGRKEIKKTMVEVQPMVKSISDEIVDVNKYNAEVIINPLTPVQADQALLTQVWINLISNALKYSAKKEQPKVEVGSYTDKNEIIYYVKDNGAGFDMEYADKLFGVFQRLHKPNDFEGTGVGLAIVHRIVTKHGGRVWAEAKPNEGAIFSFALPE